MNSIVNVTFLFDILKLTLYITCAYMALIACARYTQTVWLLALANRRFVALGLLTVLVVGIKVFEDVIAQESGPVDTAMLWFVRQNMPPVLWDFFTAVTVTGSGIFLAPTTAAVCIGFFIKRHRREAALLAVSMLTAWTCTYTLKALVDRARPELWSTAWYWGSSFPSGHTLSTAAFATSLVLGAARIWPRYRNVALVLAVLWIGLVGLSRLVLGVHWPSDVLAAVCLGVFIPLAISMALDLCMHRATNAP